MSPIQIACCCRVDSRRPLGSGWWLERGCWVRVRVSDREYAFDDVYILSGEGGVRRSEDAKGASD